MSIGMLNNGRGCSADNDAQSQSDQNFAHASAQANRLWGQGDFAACLEHLQLLRTLQPEDKRVRHNLAAVEAIMRREGFLQVPEDARGYGLAFILNTASVLSNWGHFKAALKLLRPLWLSISSAASDVQEDIILGSSSLLFELYLTQRCPALAAGVLGWLEAYYEGCSDGAQGLSSPEQVPSRQDSIHDGDVSPVPPSSPGSTESLTPKILSGQIVHILLGFRARLNILLNDPRKAKQHFKALGPAESRHPSAISLKAELEALQGRLEKAGKLILPTVEEANAASMEQAAALGNLAYLQHCKGCHYTSKFLLQMASQAAMASSLPLLQAEANNEFQPSVQYTLDGHVSLLYNAGIQSLLSNQLQAAMSFFQGCSGSLESYPLLWLRIAETCVLAAWSQTKLALLEPLGGFWEPQQLSYTGILLNGKYFAEKALDLFKAGPEVDLLCHSNSAEANGVAATEQDLSSIQLRAAANQQEQWQTGKLAALVALAFLCQQLDDLEAGKRHAEEVIENSVPSSQAWQAGHMYAAEALHHMAQPAEALQHLHSALRGLVDHPRPPQQIRNGSDGSCESAELQLAGPGDKSAARLQLCINIAATHFALNDLVQAEEFAREAAADPQSQEALLMQVYLQLCQGETKAALGRLRAAQLGISLQ